ncbi:hypothetical protein SEA_DANIELLEIGNACE_40 [Arthrobacter phage DanielleIgnace]|nr:hypothetical protein SEA_DANIELLEIGNACE_40 [Arthrobacter phage DanielleIgnace]
MSRDQTVQLRWSQTREENTYTVSRHLIDTGRPVDAVEFAHLLKATRHATLDQHPVQAAAENVGLTVEWVN